MTKEVGGIYSQYYLGSYFPSAFLFSTLLILLENYTCLRIVRKNIRMIFKDTCITFCLDVTNVLNLSNPLLSTSIHFYMPFLSYVFSFFFYFCFFRHTHKKYSRLTKLYTVFKGHCLLSCWWLKCHNEAVISLT